MKQSRTERTSGPRARGLVFVMAAALWLLDAARAIGEVAPPSALWPARVDIGIWVADHDGDGIPNGQDVLVGAQKVLAHRATYDAAYYSLTFPRGDIPADRAACADVLVRALRHAGVDLQLELWRDIARAPSAYPMVRRRDPNIDHRRVKTLLPYFLRHVAQRSPRGDDPADPVLPGDIIFFDTMRAMKGPDHVGIASDRWVDGVPLVIGALSSRTPVAELPLLRAMLITHRFRL
ncbi:MAG: DUF1287 domain-containing protein [Myxococcales bacterium]|nr:DUF1287 domain-containing protein [Myxococcales bacterium]